MTQTPKRGLGRGFESLLPPDIDKIGLLSSVEDRIERLSLGSIITNPLQPRSHFDETALTELASSIKRYGIVQPLVVTPSDKGKHVLIAGERRLRAAKIAGLDKVPAIIRSSKELEQLELALIENVQRVDLSPMEQAISIVRLHEQFSIPIDEIAKRLGKAASTINNTARLINLPEAARIALENRQISEGHARSILALKDSPERQTHLLEAIIAHGWSVREAERYVLSVKAGAVDHRQARKRVDTESPLTRKLGKQLSTTVRLRRTAKGGILEIRFSDDDHLAQIVTHLK